MNDSQKKLARHALGLPNKNRQSCRNRFFAQAEGLDWRIWRTMVEEGFAMRDPAKGGQSLDFFWLTRAGADRALEPGEQLDREDFPLIGAH